MDVDLQILYWVLRAVAVHHETPISYTALSERYEQQTGERVDPRFGWSLPLANIAYRCAGLCRPDHEPILPALVINNPQGQSRWAGLPGHGFWGLRCADGRLLTPAQPADAAWAPMCVAVYQQDWPEDLEDLPPPCNVA
jgi:hypothetical protein